MGVYRVEGKSDRFVLLRELITNTEIKAISASGYLGRSGEVWFARVLPSPFEPSLFDYSVVFTTPYLLGKLGPRREFMMSVEEDWLAYFRRSLPKMKKQTEQLAYHDLMKYGLSRNYWNEYIFLSYRNHRQDMIFLEGFPDMPASLPHSKEGRAKLGI